MDSGFHWFKIYVLLFLAFAVFFVPTIGTSIQNCEEGLNCVINNPATHKNVAEYSFCIQEGPGLTSCSNGDVLVSITSPLDMLDVTCIRYPGCISLNTTFTSDSAPSGQRLLTTYALINGEKTIRYAYRKWNGSKITPLEHDGFIVTLQVVTADDRLIDILNTPGQSWCNMNDEIIPGPTGICNISEPIKVCNEYSSSAQQIELRGRGAGDDDKVTRINLISSNPESCATVTTPKEERRARTMKISTTVTSSEEKTKLVSSQAKVSTLNIYPNITTTASLGGTSQKFTTSGEDTDATKSNPTTQPVITIAESMGGTSQKFTTSGGDTDATKSNPTTQPVITITESMGGTSQKFTTSGEEDTDATKSNPTTQPIITTTASMGGKSKTSKGPPGVVLAAVVVGMIIFLLLLVLAATVCKNRRISRSPNGNAQPKTSTIITNQAYEDTNDDDQRDYEAITDSPSGHIDPGLFGDVEAGSQHFTSNQASIAHEIIEYSEIGEQDYNVLFGGEERGNYHQYTLIPDSAQNKLKKEDFQKKEENSYQELLKDKMCQEFDEPKPSEGNAICATRGHLLDVEEKGANRKEIAGTSRLTGNHIYQPLINVGGNKSSNQQNVQLLRKPENKSSDQIGSSHQPLQVCGPEYATLEPGTTGQHPDLASVTTNGFQSVVRDTSNPDHAVLEAETLGNGESDKKIGSRRQSLQDCGPEYATLEPGTTDHSLDLLTSPANGFHFLNTDTCKPAHAVLEQETLRNGDSDQTIDSRRQSQQDCGPEYATLEPGATGQHLDLPSVTTNGFQSIERDTSNPDYAVLEPETSKNEHSDQAMDTRGPRFGRHQSLQDGRPEYATLEPDTTDHSLDHVTPPAANGFQSLNKHTRDSEYDVLEFGTSRNDLGKTLDEENKRLDHAHQGQHETKTCQSGISASTMTESSDQPYDVLQRDFKTPRESTPNGYGSLGQID